ncbi:hypothetical protein DMENIID0001_061120 [Sergentomyia squamirostris]
MDAGKFCTAVFVDMAQAFDKVWIPGLIHKIRTLLPPEFHGVLESFLQERTFSVRCGSAYSSLREANAGVPQGSVLGPMLFQLYTSDMPTSDEVMTATYVDDTALVAVNKNPNTASRVLQEHLVFLEDWFKKWRFKINQQKSTQITFTLKKRSCPRVKLNGGYVPVVNEVKYLGVHLDKRLCWKDHIN